FFPEEDDHAPTRDAYADDNVKANELLYHRVDIEDVVSAHLAALDRAQSIGFGRYIISATTPFTPADLLALRTDGLVGVAGFFPESVELYASRGWRMFPGIDRVYVNGLARGELHWRPRHDFGALLARLAAGGELRSPMARVVGVKGYHG